MNASKSIKWRIQVRKSRAHKWVYAAIDDTRDLARERATWLRSDGWNGVNWNGFGFGNTRVVRYVKGA